MTRREAQAGTPEHECDVQSSGALDLYFYEELGPDTRADVDRHLAGCASCRRALEDLAEIRAALAARPVVSAPPSGDWSAFMAGLESATMADHDGAPPIVIAGAGSRPSSRRYVGYLAMAALLALVTISVLFASRTRSAAPPAPVVAASDITPLPAADGTDTTALLALSEQLFERSKLVVLGLAAKDPEHTSGADWAYERSMAGRLLSDTRLYRMAAQEHGLTAMAGVMQDLELVLLQASLSDRADAATLSRIQRLIRRRDLLEKMNVVTTRGLSAS